jgi:hypothetical protein
MRRRERRITLGTQQPVRRRPCQRQRQIIHPLLPVSPESIPDPYLLGEDWVAALAAWDAEDALKPLPHLIRARHQRAESCTESPSQLEEVQVRGVGLPSADFADLFSGQAVGEVAASCSDILLLEHWFGLSHEQGCGLGQRGMVGREWFGGSFTWHDRELYASGDHAERQYIGYDGCRQSSEPPFSELFHDLDRPRSSGARAARWQYSPNPHREAA